MNGFEIISIAYVGSVFGSIITIVVFYLKDIDHKE